MECRQCEMEITGKIKEDRLIISCLCQHVDSHLLSEQIVEILKTGKPIRLYNLINSSRIYPMAVEIIQRADTEDWKILHTPKSKLDIMKISSPITQNLVKAKEPKTKRKYEKLIPRPVPKRPPLPIHKGGQIPEPDENMRIKGWKPKYEIEKKPTQKITKQSGRPSKILQQIKEEEDMVDLDL